MHVVLLNQAFHPDVVATAQMSKDLADELVRRGHTVTAVASRSIYGKKGAVLPKRETVDGIDVRRCGSSIFGKAGLIARLADFSLFYALATARVLTLRRPDVVVSFTTPPFIAVAGVLARWARGSRAVHWVMDLYPDVPVACGVMKPPGWSPGGMVTGFFEGLSRWVLRRSDVNVVLGRCMRQRVLSKGVPESRVRLIPVWAELGGITGKPREESEFRRSLGVGPAFTVMYSGNFGIGHDSATICEAMALLNAHPAGREIRFVFVGGGKRRAEVEGFIRQRGLTNASWHDYVPRGALGDSLAAADAHLISLRDGVEGIVVPSKLFGVMAAARASVFVGQPGSEIARVLDEDGAGVTVRPGDARGLADALLKMKADPAGTAAMGARARLALQGRYDAATAAAQWADLLEAVVEGRGRAPEPGQRGGGIIGGHAPVQSPGQPQEKGPGKSPAQRVPA